MMDRTTKTLRERVLEHVAVLRIPLIADELDHVISAAEREGLSLLEVSLPNTRFVFRMLMRIADANS